MKFDLLLKNCKTLKEIKELIENIDNDDLQIAIKDKYKQFFEYNKNDNIDINVLIMTLENTYIVEGCNGFIEYLERAHI